MTEHTNTDAVAEEETTQSTPEVTEQPSASNTQPDVEELMSLRKKDEELLTESLSVIKEVRTELADAYKTNKELSMKIEELSVSLSALSLEKETAQKTVESLTAELQEYKTKEQDATKALYTQRLEQLSAKYESLGRTKTVEQLSAMSEDAIAELETITDLALGTKTQESLAAPVTVPTAATNVVADAPKVTETKTTEALTTQEVLLGVIEQLKAQQSATGGDSRRTIRL
jgi:predicted RNase H-like nuclease (RuvC/YqgF family)